MRKDYYAILEVHPGVSQEVLNNAYRALVRKYHPDSFHTHLKSRMTARMQEINEAYQVLSDAASRARYDRTYRPAPVPQSPPRPGRLALLRRVLAWALGTYLVLKFLLKPLLAVPAVKLLLGILLVYFAIRFFAFRRKPLSQNGAPE